MPDSQCYIPYRETGYFSKLVVDYLDGLAETTPFYRYTPDQNGIQQAISDRERFPVNRALLHRVLTAQYAGVSVHPKVAEHLDWLKDDNTYTVCTAHQPNLLTGYLYFIYKIVHAIKMAKTLTEATPGKRFVPVYYMGSEDNDLDELGVFNFRGEKYVWDGAGQTGAVGRMKTTGLNNLLNQLFRYFGPPGADETALREMISNAYLKHETISDATIYLVNELFGRFGLLILNPDHRELKSTFIPIMEAELLRQESKPIVAHQTRALEKSYKPQAYPRDINLFYLFEQARERIEYADGKWAVVNTSITWNKNEMLSLLHSCPERFSPNVILRGLYQETILPNVAFIGGGAEVAYWLQLMPLFDHFNVYYPTVFLRQSAMWIGAEAKKIMTALQLKPEELFSDVTLITKKYIAQSTEHSFDTTQEQEAVKNLFTTLTQKAVSIDPTLQQAAMASLHKITGQIETLEKKMYRAEKRKLEIEVARITRLKALLFPNNHLQEREANFVEYFLEMGPSFINSLNDCTVPFEHKMLIMS